MSEIKSDEFYSIFDRHNFFKVYQDELNDHFQWVEVDLKLFQAGFFCFQGELIEISTNKVKGIGDLYFTENGVNWLHEMLCWLANEFYTKNLFPKHNI